MSDIKKGLSVKCFFCGTSSNLARDDGKVFSASILKVENNYGCLCMSCLKHLYEVNLPFMENENNMETNPKISSKSAVSNSATTPFPLNKSFAQSNTQEEENDFKDAIADNLKVVDISLESYLNVLKDHIFGQSDAIKRTAFVMYRNQFCNLIENMGIPSPERYSALLIGSTGVGKTLIAKTTAQALRITLAKSNADAITAAGYIGDKVESILERLYYAAGKNLKKAEEGIIIIDEIDKKAKRLSNSDRDINGLSVQQELLKILEPNVIDILHNTVSFDTSRLTVIFCGAFNGLKDIIKKRLHPTSIGFSTDREMTDDYLTQVTPEDLVKFGFIEEFVGRIPTPTVLNDLSIDTITDIIYKKVDEENILFKLKGFDLRIDPFALKKIAYRVHQHNTGARDVKKEIAELLFNAEYTLFNVPSNGMCDIDEYGNTSIMYTDKKTGQIKVDFYPGPTYLQKEIEEELV